MKPKTKRRLVWAVVCCLALTFAIAGCAPKASNGSGPSSAGSSDAAAHEASLDFGYADMTEPSTGLFPEDEANAKYQNVGNRGCNSCHEDLWEVTYDCESSGYEHIVDTDTNYKNGTVNDCRMCHQHGSGGCGVVFSELIHTAHYSNEAFWDTNGNCWSCHAMIKTANGAGEFSTGNPLGGTDRSAGVDNAALILFEDLMYTAALGGLADNATASGSLWFNQMRGMETGYSSLATVDKDPVFSIETNQDATAEEDQFVVDNFGKVDKSDPSEDESWMADWTLDVTGVVNSGTLTLDDIKAMPQTEKLVSLWCNMNGYNGALVQTMPVKGVLLEDFIEALGGLDSEANNTFFATCQDGWNRAAGGLSLEELIKDGAILAYEAWGHDMTAKQGGPLRILASGYGGSYCAKMLTSVTFGNTENPGPYGNGMKGLWYAPLTNSAWLADDGIQAKVGEELVIPCATFGYHNSYFYDDYPAAVEFSFDYGATWHKVELPADTDPTLITWYDFKWTPQEAGTYVLKSRAISMGGNVQPMESNIIVTVTE